MLLGGCSKSTQPAAGTIYNIKKGEFDMIVSTDGNLNTPNTYNLAFGTNGIITQILVNEGDQVHAGALLAFLDDTSEVNAVETALYNLQATIDTQGLVNGEIACNTQVPYSYPDMSAQIIFQEAENDMDSCLTYFQAADYKDAGYQLAQTYFDIDVCADVINSRLNGQQYAGMPTTSPYFGNDNFSPTVTTATNDKKVVDYLNQYKQSLLDLSILFQHGSYSDLNSQLPAARQEMLTGYDMVGSTVYLHSKAAFTYADTPTSRDFLLTAQRGLDEMNKYMADNGTDPTEISKKLYTAQESLSIGSDTLDNQKLVFSWDGFNWQTLQQYNIQLQANQIALQQAKQQIMNTVIIAPADGTITAVNLLAQTVLSTIDFAERPAIQLVDTSDIEFDGLVDEIDIMNIQKGQHADITVDAVPGTVFSGTVIFISPYSDVANSTSVVQFDVKIDLDSPAPELKGGMSATATIKYYSNASAVLVPVPAIAYTSFKQPYVALVDNVTGLPVYRPITLGHQNFQYAEVLSGLQEGDKVWPASANAVKPPIAPTRGGGGLPGMGGGMRGMGGGGGYGGGGGGRGGGGGGGR
jgi:multidrug efflux pump subunit AcrA (membrane-fusion protein)